MTELQSIFNRLSYDQILDIADEYEFYPDNELSKEDFIDEFLKYAEKTGRTTEFQTRFGVSKEIPAEVDSGVVKLFSFQVRHKERMIEGLSNEITFINASETGTGKTFMTLSLAETERRPLFVISPKSMVLEWYLQSLKHKVEVLSVCNYETMIKGKMYVFKSDADMDKLPRVQNPYMNLVTQEVGDSTKMLKKKKKVVKFQWQNLPEGTLVVFDEAHFCKNISALRTQLLISLYDYARHPENQWRRIGILLLSATIIEKKENLAPFMYVLGYGSDPKDTSIVDNPSFSVREFGRKLIAERRMTRATMVEARSALKDNHSSDIRTKVFELKDEDRDKIESLCQGIRDILTSTGTGKAKGALAKRIEKRREIEALKTGIFMSECKRLYEEGWAMVMFFNFLESLGAVETMIKDQMPGVAYSVIKGGQTASFRLKEIQKFTDGKSNIMLAMIAAGGTGISLHDSKGVRKRYSLISPPESAGQAVQCFGRLDRIGSKSDSTQRIIFIKGTLEEKIAENLSKKIKTISDLNGDDENEADNLFLFDVYHEYDGPKDVEARDEVKEDNAGTIEISVDKQRGKIDITVPEYMTVAFEKNIPTAALTTMRIEANHYLFDLKHLPILKEYLVKLNG